MKMRTRLLTLLVGLASLWCGVGPAKAQWNFTANPASGYPIQNAKGGSGNASFQFAFTTAGTYPSVESDESSTASGPNATASPDYEMEGNIAYTWTGAGPPTPLTLTFSAKASASFSNNNSSSWGNATAGASTNAASVQAGVNVSGGSATDSPPSQTRTFPSGSTHNFTVSANSYGYGYVYSGAGGSFTTGSSSTMSFNP